MLDAQRALPKSAWGPCLLWGTGDNGSEQLVGWCLAVHRAWRGLREDGDPATFSQALTEDGRHDRRLAAVVHQASFLHGALSDGAVIGTLEASRWFCRAAHGLGTESELPLAFESPPSGMFDDTGKWTTSDALECATCGRQPGALQVSRCPVVGGLGGPRELPPMWVAATRLGVGIGQLSFQVTNFAASGPWSACGPVAVPSPCAGSAEVANCW